MKPQIAAMTALVTLAGCSGTIASTEGGAGEAQGKTAVRSAAAASPDAAPYDTHLPMAEFMGHVMQHAGDGVWKWQGLVLDETGEHSLFPRNDQEWEEAESGALSLAEATNLLLIPGRRMPEAGWDNAVKDVRTVALRAARAAEKHDEDAFFAAGSSLDDACDACHVRYDANFKSPPR